MKKARSISGLAVALMLAIGAACPLQAANISLASFSKGKTQYGENCALAQISLDGEIISGDTLSVQKVVKEIRARSDQAQTFCGVNGNSAEVLVYISLDSPGGDYTEAWKIAQKIQEENITTLVQDGAKCLSACAIVFLAGTVIAEEGSSFFNRQLEPKAVLGFHAPFPSLPDREFSRDEVMTAFASAFTVYSDFMKNAGKMGVPLKIVPTLLQPRQDATYNIDTVVKALPLDIRITREKTIAFNLSNIKDTQKFPLAFFRNMCQNYYEIKSGVRTNFTDLDGSLRENNVTPFHITSAGAFHYFGTSDTDFLLVVPIAWGGEGTLLMCAFVLTDGSSSETRKADVACLGIVTFINYNDVDEYVAKQGVQGILDQTINGDDCHSGQEYAALPGDTKLSDIPRAWVRLRNETPIFPAK